jgi:hypothetical protein
MSNCGACTGETNIKLCHDHTTRIEQDLAETDNVIGELRTTMSRQDKGADSIGGGGPAGSRPPINLDALDRYEQLREVLTGWATQLEGRAYLVLVRTEDVASYLLANIEKVRLAEWAYELLDELAQAMTEARRATDRAADKISLGICGAWFEGIRCTDTITAIVGATLGRCRTCGTTVDARERQEDLIGQAWHVRGTLPEILRALKAHGSVNIPLERAKKWVQRGQLVPGPDGKHSPASIREYYLTTRHAQKVG